MYRHLAALVASAFLASALTAQPTQYGVFLLDRSGSMTIANRCQESLEACVADIQDFFADPSIPAEALVVEFDTGSNYFRILGGGWLSDSVAAQAAAMGSTTCNGSQTKLVQAICQAISALEVRISMNSPLVCNAYFYVYSDGGENASTGPCFGPADINLSAGCPCDTTPGRPPYAAGSWQALGCDRICNISFPGSCLFGTAIFNARKFNDFGGDGLTLEEQMTFRFLDSQAAQTGGTSIEIDDSTGFSSSAGIPQRSIPGGCVSSFNERLSLEPSRSARVNDTFNMRLTGTSQAIRVIFLGFARLSPSIPIGQSGCALSIRPDFTYNTGFIPNLSIPNDPAFVGGALFFQGLSTSLPPFLDVTLSNGLVMMIQP